MLDCEHMLESLATYLVVATIHAVLPIY